MMFEKDAEGTLLDPGTCRNKGTLSKLWSPFDLRVPKNNAIQNWPQHGFSEGAARIVAQRLYPQDASMVKGWPTVLG